MRKIFSNIAVGLLLLIAIGASVSLIFTTARSSGVDDSDNQNETYGLHTVRFIVRGEIYRMHHVRTGTFVSDPQVDDTRFMGWILEGESVLINSDWTPIEQDMTFIAVIWSYEILFQVDIIETEYLILGHRIALEFGVLEDNENVMLARGFVGSGTLTFTTELQGSSYRHRIYLDGGLVFTQSTSSNSFLIRGRSLV